MSNPPAMLVMILAGGEGRRIGGGKPARLLGGKTLLAHALAKAGRWSDDVRLSVRELGRSGLVEVVDAPGIDGPLAGLAAGLKTAAESGSPFLLTLPCDTPFLPDDMAARLQAGIGVLSAALAESEGRLHPVCGLWRTDALERLPGYLATGRSSLLGFGEHIGFAPVRWSGSAFFNINDAADLAEAERRLP